MTGKRKTVEEVFHNALELDSGQPRQRYLDDACVNAPDLRAEVDLMLRSNERVSENDFLKNPPGIVDDDADAAPTVPAHDPDVTTPPRRKKTSRVLPSDEQLPRDFGDYELLEKVAHGGMGVVYKARQNSLNRHVAIKMILTGQLASEDEVRRFYLEAEAAAHLDHPGIVPVFDVGCYEGQHYFSMGFVEGESLAETLKRGPLSPRTAASYVRKIALAVQAAHEQGIIHRDLKPGNVLMDSALEPRVTDFGLAKQVEGNSELTATGMVIGTPGYMPPEQASGRLDQIKATSDVYSLGAILYALLTGRPPFEATNQVDTLIQVLQEEPVAPRQLLKSIPRDLEVICLKCLEKEPAHRYQSAEDLADDVQQFLAGEPIGAKNDLRRRLRKWTIRAPVLAAHLAAILVMMLFIVINFFAFGRDAESVRAFWLNEGILAAWAVIAITLQKIHNLVKNRTMMIPLLWAALNPLFLTATLYVNSSPRELLFSLYLLLLVTTGFFRRVDLVVATTVSSLIGYTALLVLDPSDSYPSYKVMFAVTLVVTGIMLAFQVLRLKRISEKDVV